MTTINICSDLAEMAGFDEAILPLIDSANVCCGIHAGSLTESVRVARRCQELGVEVGAHPGYDDRPNFGRTEIELSPAEVRDLIAFQVAGLAAVAKLGYVKAHGALYHYCQRNREAARVAAEVARDHGVGLVGQPGFALIEAALELGIPAYREGFADRAYLPDGRLAPRDRPGAVLAPEAAAEQAIRFARSGRFDTICLHGDSPGAVETARRIRAALQAEGIATGPLAGSR